LRRETVPCAISLSLMFQPVFMSVHLFTALVFRERWQKRGQPRREEEVEAGRREAPPVCLTPAAPLKPRAFTAQQKRR